MGLGDKSRDEFEITAIDPTADSVVGSLAVGGPAWGIAFDGSNLWVTYNDSVARINSYGTITAVVPVGIMAVAVAYDGTNIWVANFGSDNVSKVDLVSNTVAQTLTAGHRIRGCIRRHQRLGRQYKFRHHDEDPTLTIGLNPRTVRQRRSSRGSSPSLMSTSPSMNTATGGVGRSA